MSVGGIAMERLEELSARIKKFNEDRDWDQFHTPNKKMDITEKKYPVEKAKGVSTKYDKL